MKNIDFNVLLQNPELAKAVRLEISGEDLISLANTVARTTADALRNERKEMEEYFTPDQVASMLHVDRVTLWRWNKKGVLCKSGLDLYKRSDIEARINQK
jgi:DNA polymerase III psi subunit